jgi:tape measure domain-containing protein
VAAKRLQWIFDLIDRMGAPARRIATSLERTERAAKGLESATGKLGKTQERVTRSTRSLGDSQRRASVGGSGFFVKMTGWYLGMQAGIAAVRGLASSILELPYAFAKAGIAAASFKENTMLGLNMMLRDPAKSKALYQEAVNFADISPFETEPTLKWYRQLVAAGVGTQGLGTPGGSRILKILAGLGDIASTQNNPGEAMDRILLQVTQMLNKGRMLGNDLRPLAESGVPLGLVYEKLAKKHGISIAEARSEKWEGKFGAGEGLQAILEASAERYGGGQLGGGMGPASRTASGLYSTLKSRWYRMAEDLGTTPAWDSMKKALDNLVNVLDPTSPTGARLKGNVELLFDKLLTGVFKRFEDPAAMTAWANAMIDGIGKLIPIFERIGKAVGDFVGSLPKVLDFAVKFAKIWPNPVSAILDERAEVAKVAGGAVQSGPIGALVQRLTELQSKPSLTGFERQELDAVIFRLRGLGFPTPVAPGQPASQTTPAGSTGAPPAPPGATGAAGEGPAKTSFNIPGGIHVHVNGARDPRAVGDEVQERLSSLFEQYAIQQGVG